MNRAVSPNQTALPRERASSKTNLQKNERFNARPLLTGDWIVNWNYTSTMKNIKSTCLSLVMLAAAVFGASGESFRTDINPALQYYQALLVAPELSQSDRDFLFTNEWRSGKLPERLGELVARYDNQFKLLRQAARSSVPCDWGIDMSPGPATLLPHLARIRAIAQAARLRVMWDLQQGRPTDARDDLLAVFALGRNSARDGVLISALVQIAVEDIICSTVAESLHLFSPEILKQLADGLAAAPPRCTMAACIPMEKSSFVDWLANRIADLQKENPGNDAAVMAGARELVTALEGPGEGRSAQTRPSLWEQVATASGGTSEGVVGLLRDEERLYDRLAAVMALPQSDYDSQAKQLTAEIQKSANPFVSLTFPAFERARQRELAMLVELAMVQAAVAYKLNGDPGLKSVPDPAGQESFAFERFVFEGVDRGFKLKSVYAGRGFPEVLIFVEKDGAPFYVSGAKAGQALARSSATR
jgi:hypothetical protein